MVEQIRVSMKTVLMCMFLSVGLFAEGTALFASVKGVEKGDVLNVRAEANYQSKKVAAIPSFKEVPFTFGIETCKKVKTSTWCLVYPLMQNWVDSFGENDKGWVNARYLTYYNRGYVLVNGKAKCRYVLDCRKDKCQLVIDFKQNSNGEVASIETKWIKRRWLKGESSFGAMNQKEDGYCTTGMYIENYLKRKKQ